MGEKKRVIFKGLGPTGNVIYKNKRIEDGAIIDLPKNMADAYIKSQLAYEVANEADARKIQELVKKNKVRRKKIEKSTKKGGKNNG